MKYIVDTLFNKTIDAALIVIAIGVVVVFGTVVTIADILDAVFWKKNWK